MAIAVWIGIIADWVIRLFAVFWLFILSLYVVGYPLYFFDKLLQSPFGKDVLLPFKLLLSKVGKAGSSGLPNVR